LISGNKLSSGKAIKFSERDCAKGSLGILDRGCELMPRLMELIKK
jgi:2,3-bisphosphoglycerate-independent phosphoglycerate mutase